MFFTAFIRMVQFEVRAAMRTTAGRIISYLSTRGLGVIVDEAEEKVSINNGMVQQVMRQVCLEVFPPVMIELRAKNNITKMCMDLADRLMEEATPDVEEVIEDADEGGFILSPEEAAREACENIVYNLDTESVCKNFWNNKSLL